MNANRLFGPHGTYGTYGTLTQVVLLTQLVVQRSRCETSLVRRLFSGQGAVVS